MNCRNVKWHFFFKTKQNIINYGCENINIFRKIHIEYNAFLNLSTETFKSFRTRIIHNNN